MWNPFAGCGAPHLANGQSAVFDPFHLIAYLGSTPGAYAWIAAGRLFTAGLGMYLRAQTNQPRVGLLLPAGAGFVASFYGTLLAGKGVVPINFLLGDREVAHCIADSGIDTIVTIPLLAGRLKDTPLKIVDLTQLPQTP